MDNNPVSAHAGGTLRPAGAAFPICGTVYGTLLNTRTEIAALGSTLAAPPYGAPPKAPILYIKPPGTWRRHSGAIPLPAKAEHVEVSATLGLVFGRSATRVRESEAFGYVRGYIAAIDACLPHAIFFRPSVKERCHDGFLPMSRRITERTAILAPDAITIRTLINGEEQSRFSTADFVRPIARLIADVTEFMTLFEGDVLLTGLSPLRPLSRAGDRVTARIDGMGDLDAMVLSEDNGEI